MKILKVPDGESPNPNSTEWPEDEPGPAVVVCRGDTHNLWINHNTDETLGQTELTEADAMVFGLSASPGTPDSQYIGVIQSEMSSRFGSRFGVDIASAAVDGDGYDGDSPPPTIQPLLQNQESLPPSDDNFQRPWDIEQWNTPAGEPPKRTPIHQVDRENNR